LNNFKRSFPKSFDAFKGINTSPLHLFLPYEVNRGDCFLFGLVFVYKKKVTKRNVKKNRNRFNPTGFGSVILEQKPVQTDRFLFGSVLSI
jgi:hypothetical protein